MHAMRMRESVNYNYEIDHDPDIDTINQQMIAIVTTVATRACSAPDGFACIGRRNN